MNVVFPDASDAQSIDLKRQVLVVGGNASIAHSVRVVLPWVNVWRTLLMLVTKKPLYKNRFALAMWFL